MNKSDEIAVNLFAMESGNQNEIVSFQGFLYSPSKETIKPAWCVHCLHGILNEYISPNLFERVKSYIHLGSVQVNIGSVQSCK